MKSFNRNFSSKSRMFEEQTTLTHTIVSDNRIVLDSSTKSLLQQSRIEYQRRTITFENSNSTNEFLTSTKSSFEVLIIHN
jgi:hypothetical protein